MKRLKIGESITGTGNLNSFMWNITRYKDGYKGIYFVPQKWGLQEYSAIEKDKNALNTLLAWIERNA